MRSTVLLLAVLSLVGCTSTRILEGPLGDSDLLEIDSLCADGCSAEVALSQAAGAVDMSEHPDSIYQRLRLRDVTLRLKDSRVLRGQVRRLTANAQTWLIGPGIDRGSLVDTVRFSISSVDSAWVAGRPERIKTPSLRHDAGVLHFDSRQEVPVTAVTRISIRSDVKSTLPQTIGATVLMGAAGGLGGWYATYLSTCGDEELDSDDGCDLTPLLQGALAGIGLGTAVGAHLGNHRRGSFSLDLLASMTGVAAGVGVAYAAEEGSGAALGVLPAVILPVVAERWLARRRARKGWLTGAIEPVPGGGAFLLALRF